MHWSRREIANAADEQLDGVLTSQMCVACKKTDSVDTGTRLYAQCVNNCYPLGMCMGGMHEMPSMELIPCTGREAVAWTGFASDC